MYFCVDLYIYCFMTFSVLSVYICVLNYCHRVATHLQLNIYHIVSYVSDTDVEKIPTRILYSTNVTLLQARLWSRGG